MIVVYEYHTIGWVYHLLLRIDTVFPGFECVCDRVVATIVLSVLRRIVIIITSFGGVAHGILLTVCTHTQAKS